MSIRRGVTAAVVATLWVGLGATAVDARPAAPHPVGTRAAASTATAASTFVSVVPQRVVDTKSSRGARPPVALGTTKLQVGGIAPVPSGAAAVVLTVTVSAPGSSGYLTVFADGATRPTTSNLNFLAGQTLADQVYAPVGADGAIDLYNGSRGSMRLIADVTGYFAPQATPVAGGFVPTTPTRLLDTRSSSGGSAPAGRSTLQLQVLGRGPVPASGVVAVAFTLTAVRPVANGYLTAYADGTTRPFTSDLAFQTGHTIGNMVISQVGTDGKIAIYNGSAGTTGLVADVSGYFLAGPVTAPGAYVPITPVRTLSEFSLGPRDEYFAVNGRNPLLVTGASAAVLNLTVSGPTDSGYAYVGAYGATHGTSSLNFTRGQAVAGLATPAIPTPPNPTLFNGSYGTARFTVDIFGYYVAPPGFGAVAGTVTDAGDGRAVAGVPVIAYLPDPGGADQDWNEFSTTTTDSSGAYVLSGLPAGRKYWICFDTRLVSGHKPFTGYRGQCWDHVLWPSSGDFNDDPGAALVTVPPGDTARGIDASLTAVKVGGIAGKVTSEGFAVPLVDVNVVSTNVVFDVDVFTDSAGAYSLPSVPPGSYHVCYRYTGDPTTSAPYGYVSACHVETVTAGAVRHLDEPLVADGAIKGRVVSASGAKMEFAGIGVFDRSGATVGITAHDNSTGDYTVSGLPPGTYRVCFTGGDPVPTAPYGFADQCYRNVPWSGSAPPTTSTSVTVTAATATTGIDATIASAGAIAGTVTSADGNALSNVGVYVFDRTTGLFQSVSSTDSDGKYEVAGLAPSAGYTVCFNGQYSGENPFADHGSECWNNVAWDAKNADIPAGTAAVSVVGNSEHTGINAELPK